MIAALKEWIAKVISFVENILGYLRAKLSWAEPVSPTGAPKSWIVINATCCVLNAVFFSLGWLPQESHGYQIAEQFYVPSNLAFCVMWFFEAVLWMIFDVEERLWHKVLDFFLACFFIIDGILWVIWDEDPLTWEILVWAGIDFAIYFYFLVMAVRSYVKNQRKAGEQHIESGVSSPSDSTVQSLETGLAPATLEQDAEGKTTTGYRLWS